MEFGLRTEALWRGGEPAQRVRFEQIIRIVPDLDGKSILDVGCGFGDLNGFLKSRGVRIQYFGLDLCEAMVAECRRRHPDGTFFLGGVLEFELPADQPPFDVSVASGIFMFPNPDWRDYVTQTVKKMFSLSRRATVVNFLSSFSQSPSPESYYVDPGETLSLLMREISPWAVLIHDYRRNDFTVGLFHEATVSGA